MSTLKKKLHITILSALLLVSCNKSPYNYPAFSKDGHVNMVIEIPAGTNYKYEFSSETEEIELEIIDGEKRKIAFLPYPGNYGFIPSTLVDKAAGGDNDPLDVLLISAALPQGIVLEIIPVAVLQLSDEGLQDDKIIAVPLNEEHRAINCTTFSCLEENFSDAKVILERWFTGYKGPGVVQFRGWKDEQFALEQIRKWQVSHDQK